MVQGVKELATRPDDMRSVPSTPMVEGENLHKSSSDLHTYAHDVTTTRPSKPNPRGILFPGSDCQDITTGCNAKSPQLAIRSVCVPAVCAQESYPLWALAQNMTLASDYERPGVGAH